MTASIYAVTITILFIILLVLYRRTLDQLAKAVQKAHLHMASQDQVNLIAGYLQKYDTCVMSEVRSNGEMQPALQFYQRDKDITDYVTWKPSITVYKYIRGDYHVVPKTKRGVG